MTIDKIAAAVRKSDVGTIGKKGILVTVLASIAAFTWIAGPILFKEQNETLGYCAVAISSFIAWHGVVVILGLAYMLFSVFCAFVWWVFSGKFRPDATFSAAVDVAEFVFLFAFGDWDRRILFKNAAR